MEEEVEPEGMSQSLDAYSLEEVPGTGMELRKEDTLGACGQSGWGKGTMCTGRWRESKSSCRNTGS